MDEIKPFIWTDEMVIDIVKDLQYGLSDRISDQKTYVENMKVYFMEEHKKQAKTMFKINVMCGTSNFGHDWLHVDAQDLPHVGSKDIYLKGYPDECVDLIYCSHGIAYFDREEVKELLQSWFRILKPQGQLRIATPDWDALRELPRPLIGPLYGKMSDPPIYHKTVYSYDELYQVLRAAGFIDIKRMDWAELYGKSDQSVATYDGKLISLNVQCIKP